MVLKSLRSRRWANLNSFVDYTLRDLKPSERSVWLILFRDTKPDGFVRSGQSDIARRAGISKRQVVRAIKGLKDRGILKLINRGQLNVGPSTYRIRGVNLDSSGHGCPVAWGQGGAKATDLEVMHPRMGPERGPAKAYRENKQIQLTT